MRCQQAVLQGSLPEAFIRASFKRKINLTITTEQFDFIIGMVKPYNNLGYDLMDDTGITQQQFDDLKEEYKKLYEKYMETDKAHSENDIKAELFEYYQQESTQGRRLGRSQQQTQVLSKDAVNKLSLNTMKAALTLEMPGFKTSLLGQRNAQGEPTSLDVEYTTLEANTVLVNFKYYLNSFKLTAQVDYILVRDQFN